MTSAGERWLAFANLLIYGTVALMAAGLAIILAMMVLRALIEARHGLAAWNAGRFERRARRAARRGARGSAG